MRRGAAAVFEREYEIITEGHRSPRWVEGHKARLRLHLIPFFGSLGLSQITAGKVQNYRIHRIDTASAGKPPARSTIHDEIVTLRPPQDRAAPRLAGPPAGPVAAIQDPGQGHAPRLVQPEAIQAALPGDAPAGAQAGPSPL